MKNLFLVILTIQSVAFANTLKSTYIQKITDPTKSDIQKGIVNLQEALKANSSEEFSKKLNIAREIIAPTKIAKKFNAAIVVSYKTNTKMEEVNLKDYRGFLEDSSSLCYNGNISIAHEVANLLKDEIAIYDEYEIDSIIIKKQ